MPQLESGIESVDRAASILRAGGVVAFPTETVYGLGADTFNETALRRIYELKGRPADNPLIAHVLDAQHAQQLALDWDARCQALSDRFWPGPLTIVVPKSDSVPDRATAGYPTIAIRSPSHDVARQLLAAFGGPISAPSANRSGRVSPTLAEHVVHDYGDVPEAQDLLILDGGPCDLGIESTVLDLSRPELLILRPGSVTDEELRAALGSQVNIHHSVSQTSSPGTSPAHYAPRTRSETIDHELVQPRLERSAEKIVIISHRNPEVPPPHKLIVMPPLAEAYAARLYASLRQADLSGADRILIDLPRESGALWDAIRDRVRRATAQSST